MKSSLSKRSINSNLKNDILKIGALAKQAKKLDNEVINATIGTYLNDDKTINQVKEVVEALDNNLINHLGYPEIRGTALFKEGLLKWFFKDNYESIINNYEVPFASTLGGTGALTLAFNLFLEAGDKVLLPNIMWGNYKLIAKKAALDYDTYQLFNQNNKFNIDSLYEKILELSKTQEQILVIINDPCQNPTGYSLSDQEYEELITRLNQLGTKINLTVLFDIAYLDYDDNKNQMHRLFKQIINQKNNFTNLFAASCSKVFGVYGLRIGALFSITKDQDFAKDFITCLESQIRGTYSCPNGAGITTLAQLLISDKMDQLTKQVNENSLKLKQRTSYFITKLKESKLEYLPYHNGFFVCLKVNNAYKLCETLKEHKVYVIPFNDDLIRIAVCSLNQEEIDRLVLILNKLIK